MKVSAQIEDVSPNVATGWLGNMIGEQRPRRSLHVKKLADDMTDGRWKVGPDAILLVKGKLANGQHRLCAIVESGTTQKMLVLRSDDHDLYQVLDCGLKRSVGDMLVSHPYGREIPPIARLVRAYEEGCVNIAGTSAAAMTHAECVQACLDESETLAEAASFASSLYNQTAILPQSIGGCIYMIGVKHGIVEKAKRFLEGVYLDGSGSAAGDLRNRLIADKSTRARLSKQIVFAMTVKAFKAYVEGRRMQCVRFSQGEKLARIEA